MTDPPLDINVISQIAVTQAVLPKIRNARGRVVFMSSVSGLFTTPGTGAYNASKYAIESLADALRMELRPWRIPVSLIEPGPIRTDMWGDVLTDYDHMTKQLTDEHRGLYASHLAGSRKLMGRLQKLAADPEEGHEGRRSRTDIEAPKRRYLLDSSVAPRRPSSQSRRPRSMTRFWQRQPHRNEGLRRWPRAR